MKKTLWITIFIFFVLTCCVYGQDLNSYTETAKVLKVDSVDIQEGQASLEGQVQYVKLKVTSGSYKDQTFDIQNQLSGNSIFDIAVKEGDEVIVVIEELEDGSVELFITDYMRQHYIFYLALLFIILIIFIGKVKGIKAVITLTFTMLGIVKILLPMILRGYHPIPITVAVSIGITILTVFIIGGFSNKSVAAIIGTTAGVVIAGLLAYYVGSQVKLTGLSSEEAAMLMYIPQNITFDFKSLLFAGIIMGALGAVMDVGMSIASAIEEIHKANPDLSRKELFSAGMNVGKDVMGTMSNTLILAYTGSSIPLLILFMAYETSLVKILNLDIIATEVIRSLAGSIGLVMTIPITALTASILIEKKKYR